CATGGFFILLFVVALKDRRLARAARPAWSLREFASTFYVKPRTSPDFAWAFASRFMFLMAYALLTTYEAFFLLGKIGSAVADVLPSEDTVAKDLGVFNIAGALPFSIAPAGAPAILAIGGGNYAVLYAAAGIFAIIGAAAILPVRGVR